MSLLSYGYHTVMLRLSFGKGPIWYRKRSEGHPSVSPLKGEGDEGTPLRLPSQRGVRCMVELGRWSMVIGKVGKGDEKKKC